MSATRAGHPAAAAPAGQRAEGARYARPLALLHWVLAALLLGQLALGWWMIDIPRGTPPRAYYLNLHKSIGVTLAALIALRIALRLRFGAPPLPASVPAWRRASAGASHAALYLCMVLQPATGYLASSFNKYGIKWFGAPIPHWGWEDAFWNGVFVGAHKASAVAFTVLVVLHIGAALEHALVGRDDVLGRMLPWRAGR